MIDEISLSCRVDELVNVLPDVIPVLPSVPPCNTICEAYVAFALGFSLTSPERMSVLPVKVFAAFDSVKIPLLIQKRFPG